MSTNQPPSDRTPEENYSPLRAVAQNPDAFVAYLADIQRVLLDIGNNLETLHQETRVHLRNTHVKGDRWYHARLRALPVERQLKEVMRHLKGLTDGLEKGAYKRRSHDEEVNSLPGKRREKELAKSKKKNPPALPVAPNSRGPVAPPQDSVYVGPTSIYDLRDRRPA